MNIVVTGASRGIGYATALQLAQQGHTVVAISRHEGLLKQLKNEHANIHYIAADIAEYEARQKTTTRLIADFPVIDVLIHNAGFLSNSPFENTTDGAIWQTFDVNFFAPADMTRALLPALQQSASAHVVNITSMGGVQGSAKFAGLAYYSASKAALNVLTECLAEEYKHTNVKFNALALGSVNTEMLQTAFPSYKAPLEPQEMAVFIAQFAITAHQYMNGKIIPVSLQTP